jgi:hypothetical protein
MRDPHFRLVIGLLPYALCIGVRSANADAPDVSVRAATDFLTMSLFSTGNIVVRHQQAALVRPYSAAKREKSNLCQSVTPATVTANLGQPGASKTWRITYKSSFYYRIDSNDVYAKTILEQNQISKKTTLC